MKEEPRCAGLEFALSSWRWRQSARRASADRHDCRYCDRPLGRPRGWGPTPHNQMRDRVVRTFSTSTEGDYSAAALPSGVYRVTAEATGFRLLERAATVEAGTTVLPSSSVAGIELNSYEAAILQTNSPS